MSEVSPASTGGAKPPRFYRIRYALAFTRELVPWWHPLERWRMFRVGLAACDGGQPWAEYPDDSPEESAAEEAYCWRTGL